MANMFTKSSHLGERIADSSERFEKLLRLCVILILVGTGITHFTGGEQYFSLYPQTPWVPRLLGTVLILSAGILLSPLNRNKRLLNFLIPLVTIILAHLSMASFVHDHYAPEQLMEQGIKVGVPVGYWLFFTHRIRREKLILFLKVCILFCFVGHGMFAVGLHFVPDSFTNMTTTILGIDVAHAKQLLFVIGILDFIAAFSIFFSNNVISYGYLILWGFLTSLARVVYGIMINEGDQVEFAHYFFNTVYRIPHGLIPLLVYAYYQIDNKKSKP